MIALIYVIEWQKRGPPHAHILAISDKDSKPRSAEDYDKIVCAEIPNEQTLPKLHKTITSLMMHGPCGLSNPKSPCMVDGKCSKNFPKLFTDNTLADSDGYPQYRRRNNGDYIVKNGVHLDNRFVVPYNPYLSVKYHAHINVEICSSIQSCKYLYKYFYKGPDMASVATETGDKTKSNGQPNQNDKDEIHKFVNSRFMTATEAYWRVFSYDTHGRDPSIQRLAVHEENMQLVTFSEDRPEDGISNTKDTTLLAWFKLNQNDLDARKHRYHEIPEHYVWNSGRKWTPRKRGRCIGRMYTTSPSQGERHYLRMLLHHIPGATSFEDLKKTPDGIICTTFKETAFTYGLLESDQEWFECMSEASVSFMPRQLRSLFVTILVFGEPAQPIDLWEKYKESMGEDIKRNGSMYFRGSQEELQKCVQNDVLKYLQEELGTLSTCLENFGLPIPQEGIRSLCISKAIQEETYDVEAQKQISYIKQQQLNSG